MEKKTTNTCTNFFLLPIFGHEAALLCVASICFRPELLLTRFILRAIRPISSNEHLGDRSAESKAPKPTKRPIAPFVAMPAPFVANIAVIVESVVVEFRLLAVSTP